MLEISLHRYKGPSGKTMFRKCYMAHRDGHQFALWYRFNRCRTKHEFTFNIKRTSNRPSCLVWKKPGGFEKPNLDFNENNIKKYMVMARCRIRQCTVRTVWFLFFEGSRWVTIDQQSSREPRKFVFIEGQTVAIRYFIFGMHLRSGLKIVAVDKKKQRVVEVSH